ncbi:hypothetical protein [Spirochaeta lutea]|uniref:Lipocalin-like domain-containing protein n=1 Tax=Spirochaeta lutea TaxID=1480694 RepID=A0A098QUI9_9SPIO|nr:hypothetical protein [Spirochaeta lutea]KGE71525.1 hypothetical protein DC28_09480 [Spirochaeta lutea]
MQRTYRRRGAFFCVLLSLALLVTLTACINPAGPDPGGEDDPGEDETVVPDELLGTWYKDFGTDLYQMGSETEPLEADAMILEVEQTQYQVVFFKETQQVYGIKGSYTLSGQNLVLAQTHEWDDQLFWQAEASSETVPISLESASLTMTPPEDSVEITLTKTVFSTEETLAGSWKTQDGSEALVLHADGTYAYTSDENGSETGTGWMVSGDTSGLFWNTTTSRDSGEGFVDVYIDYLTPYRISEGNLVLTYPGSGDTTFIPDTTTADDLAGSWITVFDQEPYTVEEGVTADAALFQFNGSDFELLFYNQTEQVFGSRGTASLMGVKIIISFTEAWNDQTYWQADTGSEWISYQTAEGALTIDGPGGELTLERQEPQSMETLSGVWANEGDMIQALVLSTQGDYEYYTDSFDFSPEKGTVSVLGDFILTTTLERWDAKLPGYEPMEISYLTPWALAAESMTLEYPDGPVVFSPSTPVVDLEDTQGVWLQDFGSAVYEFRDGEFAQVVAIEVADDEFERILYADTQQIDGNRGTLRILGEYLLITVTQSWSEELNWQDDAAIMLAAFDLEGSVLSFYEGESALNLTQTPFDRPSSWIGTWETQDQSMAFTLNADGTYTYTTTSPSSDDESGEPWSVSGTESGYFRNVTLQRDVDDQGWVSMERSYLTPYELGDGSVILSYPDGQGGTVSVPFMQPQ